MDEFNSSESDSNLMQPSIVLQYANRWKLDYADLPDLNVEAAYKKYNEEYSLDNLQKNLEKTLEPE